MKLFAPRNNWDMRSENSWWPYMGSARTSSGVRINQESANSISAWFAALRIISEGVACLPCGIFEQVDDRTQRRAKDHPLWRIVHDIPNPEQDAITFFDMQTAFIPGWGTAFAEIQRYEGSKEIAALWPIHPSRIPLSNIRRNPNKGQRGWGETVVGEPGEIVFYAKNDDGSVTPIPASDMLVVPGVMSENGITGKSIVRYAADSLGIAKATEDHAGALFKNGAVTNMVIKAVKTVGPETAERLRQQWQSVFSGVQNHYKTLILEEGMDVVPVSMNAEDTQLTLARKFSVSEIARWTKVPPHMLGDLDRATFSNVEQQYREFVIHTLGSWVRRWEQAMYRQLLTTQEQSRYIFKFNLNAMLRGDSQARSAFYQSMFGIGVFSPNDIRELEDLNPVEGGDERFIPANNFFPLTKAADKADAEIEKLEREAEPTPEPVAPAPSPSPEDSAKKHAELMTAISEGKQAISEQSKAFSDTFESFSGTLTQSITPVAEQLTTLVQSLPQSLASAVQPIAESIEAGHVSMTQALDAKLSPVTEGVTAIPQVLEGIVDSLAKQASEARNTAENDEITSKKAILDQKQAEIDDKLRREREITDGVLTLSLKRAIDNLVMREAGAIRSAREKPLLFIAWRERFYPQLVKYFQHQLEEYVASAEACGIVVDTEWCGTQYAKDSIADLKTLDCHANDHEILKMKTDQFVKELWADRSQALAEAAIARGRELFAEKQK